MVRRARIRWLKRLLRQWAAFSVGFVKSLFDSRLEHYAASLSFSTLFALIPFLALLAAIFTSLPAFADMRAALEQLLRANLLPGRTEAIMNHLDGFVANAGALGWLGAAYVALALILFARTYDFIVNDITGAPVRSAPLLVRDYVFLLLLLLVAGASVWWLSLQLDTLLGRYSLTAWLHPLRLLPWLVVWLTFAVLYKLSPNRPIDGRLALAVAFIAALIWWGLRALFVLYVTYSTTVTSIYGGVSVLLFFLFWLYISWVVFLYGLKFITLLEGEASS